MDFSNLFGGSGGAGAPAAAGGAPSSSAYSALTFGSNGSNAGLVVGLVAAGFAVVVILIIAMHH
jgi:hypothetical protein